MKVLEQTPQRLVIATGPWLLAFLFALFALVFVALGVTFLILKSADPGGPDGGWIMIAIGSAIALWGLARAHTARLDFDRMTQEVRLTRRTVFKRTERRFPLSDVVRAVHFGPGYSLHTHRTLRLALDQRHEAGPLLFTGYTSPTQKILDICQVINGWLAES